MALPVAEVGLHNAVWPIYLDIELSANNQIKCTSSTPQTH